MDEKNDEKEDFQENDPELNDVLTFGVEECEEK